MAKWIADRIQAGLWDEVYRLMRLISEEDAGEVRRMTGEDRYEQYLEWHFNQS
jgi:hypothetical protein